MKARRRIDRFIEDALRQFSEWYVKENWLGKERDCVNLYVMEYLAKNVKHGAAIQKLSQIRIECAVPQPKRLGFKSKAAAKDLVIWREAKETTWDCDWKPVHIPRVVMEWKTRRKPGAVLDFDTHDMKWLKGFTKQNPDTFGYLVTVCDRSDNRSVAWAKVAAGKVAERVCWPLQ